MDLQPGQTCNRCGDLIGENPYSICYNKDGEVTEILCQGCVKKEYMDEYNESKHISTRLMMEASLAKYYLEQDDFSRIRKESLIFFLKNKKSLLEVANAVIEVENLIHIFEEKHWAPYLRSYWNDSSVRGHEAKVSDIKVMMWGCAGRVLITAETNKASVTMIFSDEVQSEESIKKWGRSRGGIQGINATRENAITIMNTLLKADKIEFKPQKDVTMAGL